MSGFSYIGVCYFIVCLLDKQEENCLAGKNFRVTPPCQQNWPGARKVLTGSLSYPATNKPTFPFLPFPLLFSLRSYTFPFSNIKHQTSNIKLPAVERTKEKKKEYKYPPQIPPKKHAIASISLPPLDPPHQKRGKQLLTYYSPRL